MTDSVFFSIPKGRYDDEPQGEATCDNGHTFPIANFHQIFRDGKIEYVITGYCPGCKNGVRVLRSTIPAGANRDYRIIPRSTAPRV